MYKATLVLIFFVILPLFPSQAPEFINQSLLTRNWELLHLLFVGVAISYGLFSRRNDETEKEHNSKFDTAQNLVSRFLQVSSFFEDEAENPVESDETKVQTWNNQHHRNEPMVVVAPQMKKNFSFDDRNGDKPLLLPVRSLKSRLSDEAEDVDVQSLHKLTSFRRYSSNSNKKAEVEADVVDDDVVHSLNRSTSSKRFSNNSNRNAEFEADDDDDVVVQSLNRSTGSKRFSSNSKRNEQVEADDVDVKSLDRSTSSKRFSNNSYRNAEFEGDHVDVDVQSQNKSTSSKRFSSNSVRNAEVENNNKKQNTVLPSPIPWRSRSGRMESKQEQVNDASNTTLPPKEESRLVKSQTSHTSSRTSSMSPSPNLTPVPSFSSSESLAKNAEDSVRKKAFYKSCPPPPPPPPPMMFHKSVSMKPRYGASFTQEPSFDKELKPTFTSDRKKSDKEEQSMQHTSFSSDKFMGRVASQPGEEESFLDKVLVESSDVDDDEEDTETEDEDVGEGRIFENESEKGPPLVGGESSKIDEASCGTVSDEGPDVDKKADEFIAKFREQIRLQRIESIKRSTRSARNSSR